MSEDRLLHILANMEREEGGGERSRFDERWDRLAAGTLTPEEEAELRALAATSPEIQEAFEAFRPLGADFQARLVAVASAELGQASAVKRRETRLRWFPFHFGPIQVGAWLAAAGAAAMALFLLLQPAVPLPLVASVELGHGDQSFRGQEGPTSELPVFSRGSLLTLNVHLKEPGLEVRSFFDNGTGVVNWEPQRKVDGTAVQLRGTLGTEVRLPPGEWQAWVVVGRPRKIPPERKLLHELRAGRTLQRSWQAVSRKLRAGSP
jgi:hypothetical protein